MGRRTGMMVSMLRATYALLRTLSRTWDVSVSPRTAPHKSKLLVSFSSKHLYSLQLHSFLFRQAKTLLCSVVVIEFSSIRHL
jgi:hypothetical protein